MKKIFKISSVLLFSATVYGSSVSKTFASADQGLPISWNWCPESVEEVMQLQQNLFPGMVLVNFHGSAVCGDCVFLAIHSLINHPNEPNVIVSMGGLVQFRNRLADLIELDLGNQSQDDRARARVMKLVDYLMDEELEEYLSDEELGNGEYTQGVFWEAFLGDFRKCRIAFDTVFLDYVRMVFEVDGVDIFMRGSYFYAKNHDGSGFTMLQAADDHFVVTLPEWVSVEHQEIDDSFPGTCISSLPPLMHPAAPGAFCSSRTPSFGHITHDDLRVDAVGEASRFPQVPLRWRITNGDLITDATGEASYLLFLVDNFNEKCDAIAAIQARLPNGLVEFDLPGIGRCGFWAILAILFARNNPGVPQIRILREDCLGLCADIADQIDRDRQGQDPEARVRIANLTAVIGAGDGAYGGYFREGEFLWQDFLDDMRNGRIPFDYVLLPFVQEVLGFPITIVQGNDENALRDLGRTAPYGALVHVGGNHFMVALPQAITGLECQERNGHRWLSLPGMPVTILPDEPQRAPETPDAILGEEARVALDRDIDAASEASYFSHLNDDWFEKFNAMAGIQEMLPEEMVILDLPGLGRCGYFAILAILSARNHPGVPQIRISRDDCLRFCRAIADQITWDLDDQNPEVIEHIDKLIAVFKRGGRTYGKYFDGHRILWPIFFDDMRNGRIPLDYVLLPFVQEVLRFPVVIVKGNDKNALRDLEKAAPYGVLIHFEDVHFEDVHFMVALPQTITELECQERNGRRWLSSPGTPIIPEEEVPVLPAPVIIPEGEIPMLPETPDAIPEGEAPMDMDDTFGPGL
ncbi:MAG: hypothetical protein LBB05_03585 [Puniceicoccales bacterium]|nr:hypothetical protein [Puniceicoccales bacterium]